MNKEDCLRVRNLHACLRHVTRKQMTNTLVRGRFGIAEKNAATASRLLNEAVDPEVIMIQDAEVRTNVRSYLP